MSVEQSVSKLLDSLVLPDEFRDFLLVRFASGLDCIRDGKIGVGLEIILEDLYEFDIKLSSSTRDEAAALGREHGVSEEFIAQLDEQVE